MDFMNCSCADLEKKFCLSGNLIESLKDMIYTQHAVMSVSGTNLYEETLRLTKIIPIGIICFSLCIFFFCFALSLKFSWDIEDYIQTSHLIIHMILWLMILFQLKEQELLHFSYIQKNLSKLCLVFSMI